ncbi:MAG: hypothetical protein ACTHKE_05255 [Sphingomicrobium sp.]
MKTADEAAPPLSRHVVADGLGAYFLFACVIGSGIMAQNLSGRERCDRLALQSLTCARHSIPRMAGIPCPTAGDFR